MKQCHSVVPFWHCTLLGQVIKGLDSWLYVFGHLIDGGFG
jgi:hypothetical protein